jgi:uncharacterized membrane protein
MKRYYNFLPFNASLFAVLFFVLILILPILFFLYAGGIVTAFSRLGFSPGVGIILFISILIGSAINMPVSKRKSYASFIQEKIVNYFGVNYRIPVLISEEVVITLNAGGALIPIIICIYELIRMILAGHFVQILITVIAVIIVSIVCHIFAKPLKGVGIAIPFFIPPLITVLVAFILARGNAAPVAYVSGTLGTLIGADISNLNKINNMGAPVVSIGGAGTFDGIFITGILSVLLV